MENPALPVFFPMHLRFFPFLIFWALCWGCQPETGVQHTALPNEEHPLSAAAIALTKGPFIQYDGAYQSMDYPMGDVAANRGVCADVVVRALRGCDTDLQLLVHEDMRNHFEAYPSLWGLRQPDRNIDHRRVPNLCHYFERAGNAVTADKEPDSYWPGDIVAWELGDGRPHIGIVVKGYGSNGWPLVVHNIGQGQQLANVLFCWKITGHYRYLQGQLN